MITSKNARFTLSIPDVLPQPLEGVAADEFTANYWDNAVPMSAHDTRRRRLEGYKQHCEGQRVFTCSSLDEVNVMFGEPEVATGAGLDALASWNAKSPGEIMADLQAGMAWMLAEDHCAPESDDALRSRVLAMAWAFGFGNVTLHEIAAASGLMLDRLAMRYCLLRAMP